LSLFALLHWKRMPIVRLLKLVYACLG